MKKTERNGKAKGKRQIENQRDSRQEPFFFFFPQTAETYTSHYTVSFVYRWPSKKETMCMKILLDFFYINFFFFKMEITQYMLFTLFHVYTLWEDSRERETKRGHGLDKPSSMRNGPFKKKVCCPIAPRKTFIPRKYIHRKRFWAINSCDYCYFICVVVYYRLGYLRLEISRRCLSC